MKTIKLIVFTLLVGTTFLIWTACQKEQVNNEVQSAVNLKNNAGSLDVTKLARQNSKVTISCSGDCDCRPVGSLAAVYCSCDDCVMKLQFDDNEKIGGNNSSGQNSKEILLEGGASVEVPFIEEFTEFAKINHPNSKLSEIVVSRNKQDDVTVLFVFSGGNDDDSSVMFARAGGKTYLIDCTGSCGCKEVYSFGTNSASCSCDDCVMKVTEVDANPRK